MKDIGKTIEEYEREILRLKRENEPMDIENEVLNQRRL